MNERTCGRTESESKSLRRVRSLMGAYVRSPTAREAGGRKVVEVESWIVRVVSLNIIHFRCEVEAENSERGESRTGKGYSRKPGNNAARTGD